VGDLDQLHRHPFDGKRQAKQRQHELMAREDQHQTLGAPPLLRIVSLTDSIMGFEKDGYNDPTLLSGLFGSPIPRNSIGREECPVKDGELLML